MTRRAAVQDRKWQRSSILSNQWSVKSYKNEARKGSKIEGIRKMQDEWNNDVITLFVDNLLDEMCWE